MKHTESSHSSLIFAFPADFYPLFRKAEIRFRRSTAATTTTTNSAESVSGGGKQIEIAAVSFFVPVMLTNRCQTEERKERDFKKNPLDSQCEGPRLSNVFSLCVYLAKAQKCLYCWLRLWQHSSLPSWQHFVQEVIYESIVRGILMDTTN